MTFANLGDNISDQDLDRPGFGEQLFTSLGYSVLAFRKRRENWYQDLSIEDCQAFAGDLVGRYDKVVSYGSSMGAYAALYFSGALKSQVIAMSPQCSVDPAFPAVGFPHVGTVEFRHRRMRDVVDRSTVPIILYDPLIRRDRLYIRQEVETAFDRCDLHRFLYSGHPTIEVFSEMKLLREMIVTILQTDAAELPLYRARYRALRRQSVHYLCNLAFMATIKKRPLLGLRMADEALRLYEAQYAEKPSAYTLNRITRERERALSCLPAPERYRAAG